MRGTYSIKKEKRPFFSAEKQALTHFLMFCWPCISV